MEQESIWVLDIPLYLYITDIHDTGVHAAFRTQLQMRVEDAENSGLFKHRELW